MKRFLTIALGLAFVATPLLAQAAPAAMATKAPAMGKMKPMPKATKKPAKPHPKATKKAMMPKPKATGKK